MIKNMFTLCLACLILAFFCYNASGDEHGDDSKGGFSGMVNLGVMQVFSKDQLEADDDNKRIESLDKPSERVDETMPIPFFDLEYAFQNGTSLYIGVPLEDEPKPTFGVSHSFPIGNLGLFFHYGFPEEVWQDPYLTGVDRKETDKDEMGGSIRYESHDFELSYEYTTVDVDEDFIGERFEQLKRDGNIHKVDFEYEIELGRGNMLAPGFSYTLADMDGDSNSYNGYEGELSFMRMSENYMLHLSVGGGLKDYDKDHPLFNETREDKVYEAMAMISWLRPLGYERFSLNFGGGYEKTDSNIDFFDSDSYFTFITVGYRFGSDGHDDD